MFYFNQNDVNEKVTVNKDSIKGSGCYDLKIKEAIFVEGQNVSQSEGINLKLENSLYRADTSIWYKNSKGEEIKFNGIKISQLIHLTNTQNTYSRIEEKTNQNGYTKKYLKSLEGKEIGVFLTYKGEEINDYNGQLYTKQVYNIDGFYDVMTKKTTEEIVNNLEAKTYYKLEAKYNKENEKKIGTLEKEMSENDLNEKDGEEFPF